MNRLSHASSALTSGAASIVERAVAQISIEDSLLSRLAAEILAGEGPRAIRLSETKGRKPASMVFVARHEDVATVLRDDASYGLDHYQQLLSSVSPAGSRMVLENSDSPERRKRYAILRAACAQSAWFDGKGLLRAYCKQVADDLMDTFRARRSLAFDMIGEYGFMAPYLVARRVFGISGPPVDFFSGATWITWIIEGAKHESRRKKAKYPWLPPPDHASERRATPETGPYLRLATCSQLSFAQLFANFESRKRLLTLAARAGAGGLRRQIGRQVDAGQVVPPLGEPSLLAALLLVKQQFDMDPEEYRRHVVELLIEILGTTLVLPGLAFSKTIDRLYGEGRDAGALEELNASNVPAWVDESLRLSPPGVYVLRAPRRDVMLANGVIRAGEYVCVLFGAAGHDPRRFNSPEVFSLERDKSLYLQFAPAGAPHECFGRSIARTMLGEMFLRLKRQSGLKPLGPMKRFQGAPDYMLFATGNSVPEPQRAFGPRRPTIVRSGRHL